MTPDAIVRAILQVVRAVNPKDETWHAYSDEGVVAIREILARLPESALGACAQGVLEKWTQRGLPPIGLWGQVAKGLLERRAAESEPSGPTRCSKCEDSGWLAYHEDETGRVRAARCSCPAGARLAASGVPTLDEIRKATSGHAHKGANAPKETT